MPELDQSNLKDGWIQTLTLAIAGWGSLARVAIFVVLCSCLIFIGWALYSGSIKTVVQIFHHQSSLPKMDEDQFDDVARFLLKRSKADAVVFMSMDWGISGDRTIKRIYLKDGSRLKELDGSKDRIFSSNRDAIESVVALGSGEIPCSEIKGSSNMLQLFYLDQELNYQCAVSIPPEPNQFAGYIAVAWKNKEDAHSLRDLEGLLKTAAEKATKRP